MKREEEDVITSSMLREIIVNAVSHRDYSIINQKIEVGNSASRNHFIVKYLDNMRYIDGLGRGIPRVIKLFESRVIFEEIGVLFRVTVFFNQPA
ncbi:hypothetical protein KKA14_16285 [bacterium]|nr:hypothetical protein [bacterium]